MPSVPQAADAGGFARRLDQDRLPAMQHAAAERAGDHGPDAVQGEDAIDRQAGLAEIARRRCFGQHTGEGGLQFFDPSAGDDGSSDDRRVREWSSTKLIPQAGNGGRLVAFRQIDFAERDHGARDAQVGQDLQVLLRLRHPAVVGRDNEQRQIDRTDAGDHVFHEIFVTGNIDDPQVVARAARGRVRRAVRIDAGERFDERALAVVHVTGGGDNEMLGGHGWKDLSVASGLPPERKVSWTRGDARYLYRSYVHAQALCTLHGARVCYGCMA